MKTIVTVNPLSIYRAVLIWYLEKRSEKETTFLQALTSTFHTNQ